MVGASCNSTPVELTIVAPRARTRSETPSPCQPIFRSLLDEINFSIRLRSDASSLIIARPIRLSDRSCPRIASVSKKPQADRLAGQGDADRMDDLADLDAFRGGEIVHQLFEGRRVERLGGGQPVAEFRQQRHRAGCAEVLLHGFLVVNQFFVRLDEIGKRQDIAGDLDAIAGGGNDLFDRLPLAAKGGEATSLAFSRNGTTRSIFSAAGSIAKCLGLECRQLRRIKAGRGLVDAVEREFLIRS